jgi:signal transduction histidine kinase
VTSIDAQAKLTECRLALRDMALQLSQAEDEERARIAHGLHDDLGQILVAVQMRLAECERVDTEEAKRTILREVSGLVAQAIESSRSLTFELMAPLMAEAGIEAELKQFAARAPVRLGIRCNYDSDSNPKPISTEVAAAVLRVVRELLENVRKHARTDSASVSVYRTGNRIHVSVSDDGIGFEPTPPSAPERMGFGLLVVRERLAAIGGDIVIDSAPGSGTRALVTAPLLGTR